MVAVIWVSLPTNWSLASVQAGLQVVIALLCFVGVFVFARTCWQASSLDLARNRPVSLPSLISIHNLSEAYDAIFLLRLRIFHRRHWKILAQCIAVAILSVSTIVSGPIAKASTRLGVVIRPVEVNGLLSNRGFNSFTYGYVQWNETVQKLNNANFPSDQLLDFLPDPKFDWVYNSGEWNSSWTMSCNTTESTPIAVFDTGRCTNVFSELKGVSDFFSEDQFDYWSMNPFSLYEGFFHTKDALLIFTGWTPNLQQAYLGSNNLTFTVAALLMSDLNQKSNANNTCLFDRGPVGSSSYTMAQCDVKKIVKVDETDENAAYPDHRDLNAVGAAYISHFSPRVARQSASNISVAPIPPEELVRFYQAYLVSKDTYRQHPVSRTISQKIQVPQISASFLALAGLILLLNIVGMINVLWFTWRHFDIVWYTPESKLDWAVQSISADPVPAATTTSMPMQQTQSSSAASSMMNSHKRYSVVASLSNDRELTMRKTNRLRAFFESARYGDHTRMAQESIPLAQYPGPIEQNPFDPPKPFAEHHQQHQQQYDLSYPGSNISYTHMSPPEPSFYNISPYEAQFSTYDPSLRTSHAGYNPDYFISNNNDDDNDDSRSRHDDGGGGGGNSIRAMTTLTTNSNSSSTRPWNRRHYQRLGPGLERPEA